MTHKAKVWLVWLSVIIVVTIIRVLYFGGSVAAFFLALSSNLLFSWFLIMFIIRLIKPGDNKNNKSGLTDVSDDSDLSQMSEQERYDYMHKKMNHLE